MTKRQQISFNPKDTCHEHVYVPGNEPKLNTYAMGAHVLTGTNVIEAHMNFVRKYPKLKHIQIAHIYVHDIYGGFTIYEVVKYVTRKGLEYTYDKITYIAY